MLKRAVAFCEARDRLVELGLIAEFYCTAQGLDRGVYPPTEKRALLLECVFLPCNKVPHDVEKRRDMVLRLARFDAPRETEAREFPAQRCERGLAGIFDDIGC